MLICKSRGKQVDGFPFLEAESALELSKENLTFIDLQPGQTSPILVIQIQSKVTTTGDPFV